MAPFGRHFLKARLKNRSKDAEETPGKEIQVLVCQEEKVVCGVTKHTTCADVVQALLDDHKSIPESKRLLHGEPKEFCLLERWKGFERALPPLTRILRLWNAWGDERPFIQFVLVKAGDFVPPSKGTKRASKSRCVKPKRWEQGPAQYAKTLPAERQKRMVKKAFRKLEKIQTDQIPEGTEEIDGMVRRIISQDQTIRQQIHSMQELDLEIEHMERQLRDDAGGPSCSPLSSLVESADGQARSLCEDQLQEYLYTSDNMDQLELQVCRHQDLIEQLSQDIDAELRNSVWMLDTEELQGAAAASVDLDPSSSSYCAGEMEGLRGELQHSMRAGLSLHSQTQELEKELQCNNTTLLSKNQEYQLLAAQFSSLQVGDSADQPSPVCLKSQVRCAVSQQAGSKLRHTLSPTDDTDSDTGISSTHSQDSLSPCLDILSPLDTDV